jgi:plastocyanin
MRIHILPGLLAIIWAQTIFYQENFNSGVPTDWSLNTSDLGSATTLLYNRWVVSADYNGNDVDNPISNVPADPFYCCPTNCVGSCAFLGCAAGGCTPAQIPNIPNQPAAITGGPQSAFLHVSYNPAYDNVCPPATTTFSYLAPTQLSPCYPAANIFAKKSQPVAIPATATNIKLSFFWLAGGGTNAYGEVYYSTNGTTWTQLTSRNGSQQLRNNANSWYADTISLPASVAGQNLYIGFRFVNQSGSGHGDPPLGVDEIRVFGNLPGSGPTIDITSIPPVPTVCAGNSVSIAFSTTGSFNTGNQFTAQLSDAAGSFTTPLATATGAGSPISLTIPTTVATGSYKIRVVSSNPAVVSDTVDVNVVNLTNLTCTASPTNPTTGQAVTFTLNGSGLPTGTFNISLDIDNNGTPDYTQNGVTLPHSFTHTYTATGSYTAVFTLTHPGSGCTGTCQVTVNVGTPPPTIDITSIPPVPTVCAGNSVSIAFSTTGSFNTGNQFTAQLSNAAGSFAAPLATATGAGSPISLTIPTTVATGSYKIRVVSSNPAVVSDTVDVNVVNLSNLTCTASPTNPTTGQAVTFTLNGSGLPTGTFNISLDIDNNGTPDYTQNGVTLPHSFTHTYTATGTYTAVFTLTHPGSGCTGTCQVTVNVGAAPTLTLNSVQPSSVCAGGTINIQFSASGSYGAGNTFTAQLSDLSGSFANPTILGSGTSSPISAVIPGTLNSGTYQVRVVSSNPVVISNTQALTITNIQSLRCSATPNPANAGQAVQIQLTGTGLPSGTLNVSFNPGDGSSPQTSTVSSLPATFTHTYANPGSYTAVFTVSEPISQCVGTCSVPITVQAASNLSQAAGLNIRLYPNPSRGGAFLEGVPVGWEVRVVTPLGQVLYRERSDGRTLHLPSLPQGFYLVEVGAVGSLRWVVLE